MWIIIENTKYCNLLGASITNVLEPLQVILPFGLQREVDSHLKAYLAKKSMIRGDLSTNSLSRSSSGVSIETDGGLYEQPEPLVQNNVFMERILWRKSLQLRNQQQEWLVCFTLTSSI